MHGSPHIPVMLSEVVSAMAVSSGGVYVDGTFGAGGYSSAMLSSGAGQVIGIDRDKSVSEYVANVSSQYKERFIFIHGAFGGVAELLESKGFECPCADGFVLDIGVSSMQIDQGDRGFSFSSDGQLDMRMDASMGQTAADIVNEYDEQDIADIIYKYGEERHSRRISRAIVSVRAEEPFTHTLRLAEVVAAAVPKSRNSKTHPATKTFQALRIFVNEELAQLEQALCASEKILREGGRLVVVTFHSLEDRIVKNFMRERSGQVAKGSRHFPERSTDTSLPTFSLPVSKAVKPSDDEISRNPRARSAKMRVAVRTQNPAWEAV